MRLFQVGSRYDKNRDNEAIPIVNLVLVCANLLVFVLVRTTGVKAGNAAFDVFNYAFVHTDIWHLLANMWVLWVFGNKVNRRLGNLWYALACLGTVITMGVFLRLLLRVNIVGASGVVFAVIAVCLILMPAALVDVLCIAMFPLSLLIALFSRPKHWACWFVRWGRFRIKGLWCLLIIPLLEIFGLFYGGWDWTNLGHLLGLVCGAGIVLILPRYISMNTISGPVRRFSQV